jgi:hypothetical protein
MKRRAISLAELLVVLSACTIILTTSVSLLHRAMHSQSATRVFVDSERSALRLSKQFRSDVHEALSATIQSDANDADPVLRLADADGLTIEYRRLDENTIVRTTAQQGKPATRDEFSFRAPLTYSIRRESSPRRVILSLVAGSANDAGNLPSGAFAAPTALDVESLLDRIPLAVSSQATRKELP